MSSLAGDADLVRAFRNGHPEALERLYRDHVAHVDGYLRKLARGSGHQCPVQPDAFADMLQDIFVRAFSPQARRSYDGVRDYLPYLMTIARNCFIDALRAAGREVPKCDEELFRLIENGGEIQEDWCDGRTIAVLKAYVRDLPDGLHGVYQQRFVRGVSQEAASGELGLSRRALRTAEDKLRGGLRRALVGAGIRLDEIFDGDVDCAARMRRISVVEECGT
jgi:RNA polymerase sigma-70 factor (ECF subfamily)